MVLGDDEDENPEANRIVARMRLIMAGSMAVMLLGIVVVMSVIIYRTVKAPAASAALPAGRIVLPAGSRIVGTAADNGRLYVTVAAPDGTQAIEVFDAATLAFRGRLALVQGTTTP